MMRGVAILQRDLKKFIGHELDTYDYTIEQSKVNELVAVLNPNLNSAIGSDHIPATFPTVIEFWGSTSSIAKELQLNLAKVLHGEQEYEYLQGFVVGDKITVTSVVENIYEKASMNFIVINKKFTNQQDELIAIGKTTIIERFKKEGRKWRV
ncbi:MaoC family dehydratase N-terminal domain-containing protein [Sporosarcina soli]|uniref:MaoC family dehydratase N-terminal domain-containing protein n=1 Tax=Sporosarcina soli TaxID=334736 RepID=A0ABW0TEY0_9BACL